MLPGHRVTCRNVSLSNVVLIHLWLWLLPQEILVSMAACVKGKCLTRTHVVASTMPHVALLTFILVAEANAAPSSSHARTCGRSYKYTSNMVAFSERGIVEVYTRRSSHLSASGAYDLVSCPTYNLCPCGRVGRWSPSWPASQSANFPGEISPSRCEGHLTASFLVHLPGTVLA